MEVTSQFLCGWLVGWHFPHLDTTTEWFNSRLRPLSSKSGRCWLARKKEGWFNKNRFRQLKVRLRSFTTSELWEGGVRHHTTHHSPHPGLVHSCWSVSWNQSFTALLYLANPPLYVVVNDHFRFLLVSQSCSQFVLTHHSLPICACLWPRDGEDEKRLAARNRLATTGYLCFNYNWVLLSAAALHLVLLVWSSGLPWPASHTRSTLLCISNIISAAHSFIFYNIKAITICNRSSPYLYLVSLLLFLGRSLAPWDNNNPDHVSSLKYC